MNSRTLLRLSYKLRSHAATPKLLLKIKNTERIFLNTIVHRTLSTKSEPSVLTGSTPSPWLDVPTRRLVVNLFGVEEQFPWVWLRDSCQCKQCFEPISSCRVINLTEWDLNVRPVGVQV